MHKLKLGKSDSYPYYLLVLGVLFLLFWFRLYATSKAIPSVDLPGHVALIEGLILSLSKGKLFFYDFSAFSGWPAFQFYGFFSHLLAALFAIPLQIFSESPVTLSVNLILWFGVSFFPLSVFFASRNLLEKPKNLNLLALLSIALSFWFLNHDGQWHGIGAASVMHVGLFSQLLAWHLLLVYLGLLFRFYYSPSKKTALLICFCLSALLLTHTLTWGFAFIFGLFFILWTGEGKLIKAHVLSLLLSSFWLVPFIVFSKEYLPLDILRPKGDILELFFRYPLFALRDYFFSEGKELVNLTGPLLLLAFLICLFSKKSKEGKLFYPIFTLLLFLSLIFSSGFIASSFQLGIHYYRMLAYIFLLMIVLISAWIVFLVTDKNKKLSYLLMVLAVGSIVSTAKLPHLERFKISALVNSNYLADEREVLSYLSKQKNQGRVLFEYFDEYERFPFLSAHFMPSALKSVSGLETVNGLFLQSALSHRFPMQAASGLKAKTYNVPLLDDFKKLSSKSLVERLVDLQVAYVVIGRQAFLTKLKPYAEDIKKIGKYHVAKLAESAELVSAVKKPILAYYDAKGNLPFHFLDIFTYSSKFLFNSFELIQLNSLKVPDGVSGVIVNGLEKIPLKKELSLIRLDFSPTNKLNHYSVRYQHNMEFDAYEDVKAYLTKQNIEADILKLLEAKNLEFNESKAKISINQANSEISVSDIRPGQFYKIAYSYFPFFLSEEGEIYRGGRERMFLLPTQKSVVINYSYLNTLAGKLGLLISILVFVYLLKNLKLLFR